MTYSASHDIYSAHFCVGKIDMTFWVYPIITIDLASLRKVYEFQVCSDF